MKNDIASKVYLSDPRRIADLINGSFFQGRKVIQWQDIEETNGQLLLVEGEDDREYGIRHHDIICKAVYGMNFVIVGLENQNDIHYAMVVRYMEYIVKEYASQVRRLRAQHRQNRDLTGAEYLSGISRYDRLHPVIILVVYYGEKKWDAAKELKDMLDWSGIPREWKYFAMDCRMNLLEVNEIQKLDCFETDIKLVFGFLQRRSDGGAVKRFVEDNRQGFSHLAEEAYDMISSLSRTRELESVKSACRTREGAMNMCKAIEDLIIEGKLEGKLEGKEEGRKEILRILHRQIEKGCSIQEIEAFLNRELEKMRK